MCIHIGTLVACLSVIAGVANTLRYVFQTPSFLKSSDWIELLSPVGVWIIEMTDMGEREKRLAQRFMLWLFRLRAPVLDVASLDALELEGYVLLTEMEIYFPLYTATISRHMLLHLVGRIRLYGPVFGHWMYIAQTFPRTHVVFCWWNAHVETVFAADRWVAGESVVPKDGR